MYFFGGFVIFLGKCLCAADGDKFVDVEGWFFVFDAPLKATLPGIFDEISLPHFDEGQSLHLELVILNDFLMA